VAFGVREFIRRDLEIGPAIGSYLEWQTCWKTPGEDTAFLPTPWRALAVPADRVRAAYFDTDRFARRLPPATDDNPPGCRVLGLKTAEPKILDRADVQITRPTWIPRQPRPRPHLELKIADHPDLGLYLAQHPPPPHAVIVVEGSGRRETSPVVVDTEGLKLIFRDLSQGTPLVLVPKMPAPDNRSSNALSGPGHDRTGGTSAPKRPAPPDSNGAPAPDTDTGSTALFTVNGGSLELVGGRFQLPDHHNPIPAWLLKVNAGSFVVRNCSLLGRRNSQSDNQGLIHWVGQQPHGTGQIVGSYLIGSGTLLKAAFVDRHLLIDNSLLVSTNAALDLALDSKNPPKRSTLDIRHSTISAAKAAFLIRDGQANSSAGSSENNHVGLELFIDQVVFVPPAQPNNGPAAQPVLLYCSSRHLASGHVRWIGTRNGFHSQLTRLLHDRTAGEPDGNSGSVADFDSLFPPPKRIRPLHGPNAVKTATQTADLGRVRPQHFQLTSDSKAHSWGPGGRPIGADLETLDTQLGDIGPARSGRPRSDPDF